MTLKLQDRSVNLISSVPGTMCVFFPFFSGAFPTTIQVPVQRADRQTGSEKNKENRKEKIKKSLTTRMSCTACVACRRARRDSAL